MLSLQQSVKYDSLEEKGMLIRQINPRNKPGHIKLRLTDLGASALEKWNVHCLEVEEISLQGFSDDEKEQFRNYLERMYFNLSGKEIR